MRLILEVWLYVRYPQWITQSLPTSVRYKMSCVHSKFNSLGPNDAIWRYRFRSTLAQVMACHLMAPSHYLSPKVVLWYSLEINVKRRLQVLMNLNSNVVAEIILLILTLYMLFFFRKNINIYLHFMSFLQTNKTQVVEIPPLVRQWLAYST